MRAVVAMLALAHLLVALLDIGRFHWSDTVPPPLHLVGLAAFTGAAGLIVWATAVNRFFSTVVRIQTERDHLLVREGPYRFVRHAGYGDSSRITLRPSIVYFPSSTILMASG